MKKEKVQIKGYKVTDSNMQCRSYQYELNKIFKHTGVVSPCNSGFHYCVECVDCFSYYDFNTSNRVFEIIDHGTPVTQDNKSCTNAIELIRELSWLEVLELCNLGKGNSGIRNAGNYNAGNDNAGNRNAGYSNAGNYNAGNYNAGNRNAGNDNAGYSNAGNDNAGAFNNLVTPNYMLFNKPSDWTYEDFINSDAYKYLSQIDTTIFIPDYKMSDEEKVMYPYYVTTGGYIKNLPYKEAFQNAWNNWSDAAKESFQKLPNFDKDIFKDITGIDV